MSWSNLLILTQDVNATFVSPVVASQFGPTQAHAHTNMHTVPTDCQHLTLQREPVAMAIILELTIYLLNI